MVNPEVLGLHVDREGPTNRASTEGARTEALQAPKGNECGEGDT